MSDSAEVAETRIRNATRCERAFTVSRVDLASRHRDLADFEVGARCAYTIGMSKTKAARVEADVEGFRAFFDASGAPATLRYRGYAFAFDMLGEIRCNNIAPRYGSRVECKIAREVCERTYLARLAADVTDEWRVRNREMYIESAAD